MRYEALGSLILGLCMTASLWAQGPARIGQTKRRATSNDDTRMAAPGRGGNERVRGGGRRNRNIMTRGFGQGRGQQIDTSVLNPKRLTEELKLEWNQKEELQLIFREYEAAVADLRRQSAGNQSDQEKQRLQQELKAARSARDHQRAARIYKELSALRTSASDEERQYQEMLIEEIEKILDDGQKVQFRQMLRPDTRRGKTVGPLEDPKVLAMCLKQVKLQDYQKTQIQQIQQSHENQAKQMGKSIRPEEKKRLGESMLREVMMVLDEDQKKQLKRVHMKMGGGSGGGPIDINDPSQLQYAVTRLNTTKNRLSKEQQLDIGRIQKEYMARVRQMPRDDEMGRKQLNEQIAQQVMMILTREQQEAVKGTEAPAGRFLKKSPSGRSRRMRPDRGDRGSRSRIRSRSSRNTGGYGGGDRNQNR